MALLAFDQHVTPQQGVRRHRTVVERGLVPRLFLVACLAFLAFLAFVLVVLVMTGRTFGR